MLAYFTESVKHGGDRKTGKGKLDKKSKSPLKLSKETEDLETPLILLEVGSPRFSCRIDYTLIPNEINYWLDIKCWDKAVKVK